MAKLLSVQYEKSSRVELSSLLMMYVLVHMLNLSINVLKLVFFFSSGFDVG